MQVAGSLAVLHAPSAEQRLLVRLWYPENTLNGRFVVLTNERAGSDGDIFPRAVQLAKLAPVIGTRTWGGVVGIDLKNPLVDKGVNSRPYYGWFEAKRGWQLEGEGVTPDIEIDNDVGVEYRGTDTQLDKGIEVVLDLLAKNPPPKRAVAPFPDKRKETWVKQYGQTDKP